MFYVRHSTPFTRYKIRRPLDINRKSDENTTGTRQLITGIYSHRIPPAGIDFVTDTWLIVTRGRAVRGRFFVDQMVAQMMPRTRLTESAELIV